MRNLAFLTLLSLSTTLAYYSVLYPYKPPSLDSNTYANLDFVRTQHFDLQLRVDFDKKMLSGIQIMQMNAIQDVSEVVLDV